jgi:hypothetical protein
MAFNLVWKVEFGDIGGLFDITSLVFDTSIDMNANIGSAGRTTCQITLNNNGGQFTPGGTGTYGSVDWFKQAIIVSCTGGGLTEYAFVGLLQDFDIDQKSTKESTVTISALDFLSVAGRSSNQLSDPSGGFLQSFEQFLKSYTNPAFGPAIPNISPLMGSTSNKLSYVDATTATNTVTYIITRYLEEGTLGDWTNNQVLPTGPGTTFATDYSISSDRFFWNAVVIDSSLNRTTNAYTTTIVDGSAALTSGQIAFNEIDVGFQLDTLTNVCNAIPINNGIGAIASVSATNTTSQQNYGVRSRTYASCVPSGGAAVSGILVIFNNQFMETVANFWPNRYGTVRYIPSRVITAYSTLRKYSVDDGVAMQAFMRLLSAKTALWNRQAITYKGAGMSSSQTTQTVTTGRKIMITPSDTRVELTVVSGIDNQSFELDSSTYGILDTNRLG